MLRQLMNRLVAKSGREWNTALTHALARCVLNVAGEPAGCPLARLFLLDYKGSPLDNPDHLKHTVGDRLHTLLMGEAICGKNTRCLQMLLSCERFVKKDPKCSLHQALKATHPFHAMPPATKESFAGLPKRCSDP